MNKVMMIALISVMMTACGKSVSHDGNTDLTNTPTTPPPTTVPTAPNNAGTMRLPYSAIGRAWKFSETLLILIPSEIAAITFASNEKPHYEMTLTVNGQVVCSFIWNGSKYVKKNTGGPAAVILHAGDLVNLSDVPQGETATLVLTYQKQI